MRRTLDVFEWIIGPFGAFSDGEWNGRFAVGVGAATY
jgi:hypothetical protein